MRSFTIITAFLLPFLAVCGRNPMYLRLPGDELLDGCNIYDPLNRQNYPDGNVTVEIFSRRHKPGPSLDQDRGLRHWSSEDTDSAPSRRADYSAQSLQKCLVECRKNHHWCKGAFAALDAPDIDFNHGLTEACLLYSRALTIDDFEVVESGWTYGRAGNLDCDHAPPADTGTVTNADEDADKEEQKKIEVCV